MQMIMNEFQMHIDAKLYDFKFKDAQYVTVKYSTLKDGKAMMTIVSEVGIGPALLRCINNLPEVIRQAEDAAKSHAEFYWSQSNTSVVES